MIKIYASHPKHMPYPEEIDSASSETEADELVGEYQMAYGEGWKVWKEGDKR